MFGRELDTASEANMTLYLMGKRTNPDLDVILYGPGSHGHMARGTKDLQMSGEVKKHTARTVLGGSRSRPVGVEPNGLSGHGVTPQS